MIIMTRRLLLTVLCLALAMTACAQSQRTGMGTTLYPGGAAFRVWAPNADAVHVAGSFNGWSPTAHPLVREAGGLWSADVEGAAVGDRYRYVIRSGEVEVTRRDPYSRLVTDSDYANGLSIIYDPKAYRWQSSRPAPVPRTDLVIYEMQIGTFNDTNPDGPGTFDSAIERLDHIVDLGVNAIEILPVNEYIGRYSGGYNPADPFAVENIGLGGPDAMKRFVDACHQRGLHVILDVVYNHWGPWDLATHQFDGWFSDEYPGGIYLHDAERINSPWGPRPNYSEPMVRRYLLENLKMWVEEYRVSGFRFDSTSNIYNTNSGRGLHLPDGARFLRDANRLLHAAWPGLITIAEDLITGEIITEPLPDGGGFDAQWHFLFAHLRPVVSARADSQRDMNFLAYAIRHEYNGDPWQRIVYSESHNEPCCGNERLTVEIDPDDPFSWAARKRSTLAAAIALTTPGIPMLWQGQEFLDPGIFDPRTPLDWSLADEHAGIVALYRDLITLRRNRTGTTAGLTGTYQNVYHINNLSKVIAIHRRDLGGPGDDVIILANFSGQTFDGYLLGLPEEGQWLTRLNSDAMMYSPDYTGVGSEVVTADGPALHGMPTSGLVTIAPYSVLILSQE